MAKTTFSAALMRNPGKAAKNLAYHRQRLAELHAGMRPRAHESVEEHQRIIQRLERAFRDTGRCEDCGKALTDPVSIERGVGPECIARRALADAETTTATPDDGRF